MPSPLTESLLVHWRPTLDYHLHRLDVLAEFKASGSLESFLVRPDAVGLRTANTQMTMSEDELALHPRGSLSAGDALTILRSTLRCAMPAEFHCTLAFQFLVPIDDASYGEARLAALERLSLAPLGASDFAIMADGKVGEDVWHCEFGIVLESEVQHRMQRRVGRTRQFVGETPPFLGVQGDVAPVSLFADLVWQVPDQDASGDASADDIASDIASKVESLRGEANRLVSAISGQICQASLQTIAEGADK